MFKNFTLKVFQDSLKEIKSFQKIGKEVTKSRTYVLGKFSEALQAGVEAFNTNADTEDIKPHINDLINRIIGFLFKYIPSDGNPSRFSDFFFELSYYLVQLISKIS